ncbi:hypothetical protein CAPN004_10120 [Capnocytophaga cynodegmi]|uniref:hypothetical protein n=1 Tax=Capnocytophaga cynodegmi TaxID=28189 RepID=UPI001AC2858B|nr:hypothetical protein [Capnocytophaga cynodegmi]GIM51982.1 hypothetical protein CAPN004_10120 [Capnocytophaga cynodegmi]
MQQDSFSKGEAFQKYVKDIMFPAYYYSMVRETPAHKYEPSRFNEDYLNPDFTFRRKKNDFLFHIEAKWRSFEAITEDCYLNICSPEQLQRYKSHQEPVYIALGVGGKPENPTLVFVLPVVVLFTNKVPFNWLCRDYMFYKNKRVFSVHLMQLIEN